MVLVIENIDMKHIKYHMFESHSIIFKLLDPLILTVPNSYLTNLVLIHSLIKLLFFSILGLDVHPMSEKFDMDDYISY